ncbi:tetratricopeptide repeat protein [Virgibacillus ainsalahensis]
MQNQSANDNVILFPKWKTILEEESLQALKEKKYEKALSKLNKLISYQVNKHEIIIGKLICLMELGRYNEAQNLCEEFLNRRDENYYHYFHIYLTILFQTDQYSLLMEQVEFELETDAIPSVLKEQFEQLYNISEKMKSDLSIEESKAHLQDFYNAVKERNHTRQWHLVENLRRSRATPERNIISYLADEEIHPVVQTAILKWLKDSGISQDVDIHKLDLHKTIKPTDVLDIKTDPTFKQIYLLNSELEQKNPSLFYFLDKLLFRYAYVRYPIMPSDEDAVQIAEALKQVGSEYLHLHTQSEEKISDTVTLYMKEIKVCNALYMSIFED